MERLNPFRRKRGEIRAAAFCKPSPRRPATSNTPIPTPPEPVIVDPPIFSVRIPSSAKADVYKPLAEVISRSAHRAGESPQFVANLVSHFLESLTERLTRGEVITVPGFGRFAARWWHPGKKGGYGHAIPIFIPAHALRQELRWTVLPDRINPRALNRYRKRNAMGAMKGRERARTFITLQTQRRRLLDGDGKPPLSH